MNNYTFSVFRLTLWPILLFIIYSPFSDKIDLWFSHLFFIQGHFIDHSFFKIIYDYGVIPAWILVGLSIIIFIFSFFVEKIKKFRMAALYLILTLLVGSGLIVHAFFKDHWGRPRPKQVVEFNGTAKFRPYYLPDFEQRTERHKSFPCGHCSMGFYFFALALLGGYYFNNRAIYILGMSLAWSLGLLLSITRIAQGGHFLSDVIASGLIMWLTSVWLYYLMLSEDS